MRGQGIKRKDARYARKCVRLVEDLYEGRIEQAEFERRAAALEVSNNVGPEKPEKPGPPPRLPGLDGVA